MKKYILTLGKSDNTNVTVIVDASNKDDAKAKALQTANSIAKKGDSKVLKSTKPLQLLDITEWENASNKVLKGQKKYRVLLVTQAGVKEDVVQGFAGEKSVYNMIKKQIKYTGEIRLFIYDMEQLPRENGVKTEEVLGLQEKIKGEDKMGKLTEKEKAEIIQKVKENSTTIHDYIASQIDEYETNDGKRTMLVYYDYDNDVCYTHFNGNGIVENLYYDIQENKAVLVYEDRDSGGLYGRACDSLYDCDDDDAADIYRDYKHGLITGEEYAKKRYIVDAWLSNYIDEMLEIKKSNIRLNVEFYTDEYSYVSDED